MSTLYVTHQDTIVRKTDERLKVTQKTETLLDVPMLKVSEVVVFGRVMVTAATLQALLDRHITVCYLSEHGRYLGRIEPALSKNALLRSAQYRAAFDPARTLALARQIVRGKLTNMRVLLQRANRDTDHPLVAQAIDQLKERLATVAEVRGLEQLRGLEGAGSAVYFGVFDYLLKPSDMRFAKRVRRPPTDPVNALLSFGYALLANDIHSAVNTVGFDPYQGYLHVEHYGRPSLALDLMEEFRPLIVDSVVLLCINKRIIGPEDFTVELGNVHRLTDAARRKFLMQYEERKNTEIQHPIFEYKASYQRCFELQARLLAKALKGEITDYPRSSPGEPMYIVVSYDMEDDKRRGRIHRILKSFGQWVQYSVFECDLTRAQYLVLRDRLDDSIKKAEGDSVRFYFLCEDCQKKVERIGGEVPHQGGTIIV